MLLGENILYKYNLWTTVGLNNSEFTQQDGSGKKTATLCDKRDNNFVSNNFPPNFTFL